MSPRSPLEQNPRLDIAQLLLELDPSDAASVDRLIAALDVPDCSCPRATKPVCVGGNSHGCVMFAETGDCECPHVAAPCPHILAASHALPVERWAAILEWLDAEAFAEPPPPATPALVQSEQARVAIYEERARLGLSLFHPGDLWRRGLDLSCAPLARHEPNGALSKDQPLVITGEEYDGE